MMLVLRRLSQLTKSFLEVEWFWGVFATKRYSPNVIRVSTEGLRAFSKEGFVSDKAFFLFQALLETLGFSPCPNFLSVVFCMGRCHPKGNFCWSYQFLCRCGGVGGRFA